MRRKNTFLNDGGINKNSGTKEENDSPTWHDFLSLYISFINTTSVLL